MHKPIIHKSTRRTNTGAQRIYTFIISSGIDDDIWVCDDDSVAYDVDQVNYKIHLAEWNWTEQDLTK